MILNTLLIALVAAASAGVKAQDPGSLGITPCMLACITPAAQANNCSSFADIPCVCGSAQFQADARACMMQHCTAADLEAGLAAQSAQCGAVSITPSGTAGPPQSLSFTSPTSQPTAGTSNTGSPATTTTSGASTSTNTAPATSQTAANNSAQAAQRVGWGALAVLGAIAGLAL